MYIVDYTALIIIIYNFEVLAGLTKSFISNLGQSGEEGG